MFQFLIIGIIQGAVIGLVAIGIVLVYKGSRVFNFAQAEFGTIGGFMLYVWLDVVNVPYLIAIPLALAVVGFMGFLVERIVVRPLLNAPRITLLVATAGVALLSIAAQLIIGGAEIRTVAPIREGNVISGFLGASITWQQLLSLAVLGGLAAGLGYFFNKTDLGLAVLATSQEPVASELVGIGTKKMSTFVWVFAALLGGVAGILQAPDTTFVPGFMTLQGNYLLLGFTAAVLGGITSLAGAFLGGQLIGIIQSLGSYFDSNVVSDFVELPGFPDLLVFVVLLTILLVRPKGLLGTEA